MTTYTLKQWRADARAGLLIAAGVAMISAVPFALLALLNVWRQMAGQALEFSWTEYLLLILVVWGAYFVASQLGAAAYFVLRPVQRWALGWVITGSALATAVYGTIGYALAIFHDPVGRFFLRDMPEDEAWAVARFGTVALAILGAIFGAYHAWRVHTGRAARS